MDIFLYLRFLCGSSKATLLWGYFSLRRWQCGWCNRALIEDDGCRCCCDDTNTAQAAVQLNWVVFLIFVCQVDIVNRQIQKNIAGQSAQAQPLIMTKAMPQKHRYETRSKYKTCLGDMESLLLAVFSPQKPLSVGGKDHSAMLEGVVLENF